jgi:hypothetical protein
MKKEEIIKLVDERIDEKLDQKLEQSNLRILALIKEYFDDYFAHSMNRLGIPSSNINETSLRLKKHQATE